MDMMIKDGDVKVYERLTITGRTMQCLFCTRCGSRLVHMGKGEEEKEGVIVRWVLPDLIVFSAMPLTVGRCSLKGGCLKDLTKDMLKDTIHIGTTSAIIKIP